MPLLSRRSAADLAPAVPCLGRWASLRFAFDPDGFLAAGRALGARFYNDVRPFFEPWAFRLDGRRVVVVGEREAADVVLQGPTRFYRGEVLAPLLGRASPLLDLVPRVDLPAPSQATHPRYSTPSAPAEWLRDAEGFCGQFIAQAIEDRAVEILDARHGRLAWRQAGRAAAVRLAGPFDLAPALHRAAQRVALRTLGCDTGGAPLAAASALLDAADTPALVVPALRRWSPRWRRLAAARVGFLRAIGLEYDPRLSQVQRTTPWGTVAAGEEGLERAQDWAVTTLVGAVDAPVALALDALACRVPPIKLSALAEAEARAPGGAARLRTRRRVEAALERRGPIPLLLREVVAPLEVPGLGLLQPGAAVAVDAALAGYPFGAGPHACTGARLGRAFAEAAALVFAELGLEVARPPGRRERRRLVVSLPELIVRRRA